jgi:branched-chain amino acid transport system substrate-binding protein
LRLRSALALGLTAPLLLGVAACGSGADKPVTVVIGADLSLTGADQQVGQIYAKALKLQVKRLNKQNARQRLVLRIRDDGSEPDTAVSHITSFQGDSSVDAVVIGPCDECVAAVAPLAKSSRLPIISLAPGDLPAGTAGAGSALFRLAPSVIDDASEMVDGMASQHVHKLGIVVASGDYGDAADTAMRTMAGKSHIKVTRTFRLGGSETIGASTLADDMGVEPDAVSVWAPPDSADEVVDQLHQIGYHGGIYLDAAAASDLFFNQQQTDLDGAYLTYPEIMSMDDIVASTPAQADQKRWFEDYTSQYGEYAGPSSFAADAVQVISDAVQVGGTNRAELRSVIETTQLDGLSGTILFTPANHSGLTARSLTLLRASNDRWHAVSIA